jgi:hypothetical protein
LNNHRLGVELTFYPESRVKIRLREYPEGALVLYNIRFYGRKARLFRPFEGQLPLGLQFGASKDSLIKDCGPPDTEIPDLGLMRWDRQCHSLFAMLSAAPWILSPCNCRSRRNVTELPEFRRDDDEFVQLSQNAKTPERDVIPPQRFR